MSVCDDLIRRGHFPKELPPPFDTSSFADFAHSATRATLLSLLPKAASRCVRHNIARPGSLRRQLSIPNPGHHFQLACAVDDAWTATLVPLLSKAKIAASTPVRAATGRAFDPKVTSGTEDLRAHHRAAGRFILHSDIQNFYPSLYTHSIPWALHSKPVAKKDRSTKLVGNRLDAAVRKCQDDQTIGVPIGPDASMVIAESVLAAVESELLKRLPKLRGYRYWDDIELTFGTRSEAEAASGVLQEILADYELSLNPRKTRVVELPEPVEEDGIPEIRTWEFRATPAGLKRDLHGFFDQVFRCVAAARGGNAAAFAIGRLRHMAFDASSWELVQANALQLLVAEPSSARHVAALLEAGATAGHTVNPKLVASAMERLAVQHSPLGQGSEIAWGVWLCIRYSVTLSAESARAIGRVQDDIVALLALHAKSLLLTPKALDVSLWEQYMVADELWGPHWLLSYEARVKGWLPSAGAPDHIAKDKLFSAMRKANVQFYDVAAPFAPTAKVISVGGSGGGGPYPE